MQPYDILMLVVLGGAIAFGLWKGLAWQVASLGSIVLSYFAAYTLRGPVSEVIQAEPPWNKFLAMLILFMGTWIGVWVVFRYVRKAIDKIELKDFDRHAGAAVGAVKGVILCVLITFFGRTLLSDVRRETICHSRSGYYISKLLDHADVVMPAELHSELSPYLDKLEKELDHDHPEHRPHGSGEHADEHDELFDAESIFNAAKDSLGKAKG